MAVLSAALRAAAFGAAWLVVGAVAPGPAAGAHRTIATAVPAVQAQFDRGLLALYAFNVGAARETFRAAERLDPHAVMPYVGEAIAETIDINSPTTPDGERRGADAVRRARAASTPATPDDERALLAAVASRFDAEKSPDARFTAYFRALQADAQAHPQDGTVLTLAAYAGWNATGRLTGQPGDELTADARTIAADLDAALALDRDDVGAHHLRIHFWEQAGHPERALADADFLAGLTYAPGESHLLHMAGHIDDRLGDYARMIDVNEGACANDAAYFKLGDGPGQTYMRGYHEHDVAFVLYGLTTVGRAADARAFAAAEDSADREDVALRLHDDRTVLQLLGGAITPMRVIAEARSGDLDAARRDLAGLGHGGSSGIDAADAVARAAVDRAARDFDGAIAAYRQAAAATDDDLGDPKTDWWMPIGEGLGAVLLEAGRPAEAEAVFRRELARYPNDPHLEYGLAQALAARHADDAAARAAYREHWLGAAPLTVGDLG